MGTPRRGCATAKEEGMRGKVGLIETGLGAGITFSFILWLIFGWLLTFSLGPFAPPEPPDSSATQGEIVAFDERLEAHIELVGVYSRIVYISLVALLAQLMFAVLLIFDRVAR